ncbi:putative ABC transport system ATP-binding protein [Desulforamulus putei DSM 12395]|uniref:Putative ABC transport system ATP-binding protein n=1 Tax=Desulforamulus putei DSM 12395 TaxID=1121429 RepID=A0A1M4XLY2_9FIRM|nr:ATP-binding cassette domain-containing protein [Desulforamulus putei]SHE94574.1 putative ABC transport system ATP-binding protein [Desulforamulus putei DSM 12395]
MLFTFQNITYTLGTGPARQITVSGSVSEGGVLVVRGPSGAGKTTLLRVLARLQPCDGGEVFLQGESWQHIPSPLWRVGVHYLAQKPALFDGTVADNLAKPFETRVGSKHRFDPGRAKALMQELLLDAHQWEQDSRTLSGGEAARVAFIRALLIEPKVMLLDEPTAALDGRARAAFYRTLSRWLTSPGHAALLVSHNNDYQGLDRVSFVDIDPIQGDV